MGGEGEWDVELFNPAGLRVNWLNWNPWYAGIFWKILAYKQEEKMAMWLFNIQNDGYCMFLWGKI